MSRHKKCRYGRITVSLTEKSKKSKKVEKVALCSVMLFHTNTRSLFLTSTPNSKWGPYSRTRFSLMLVSFFTRRARDKMQEYSEFRSSCNFGFQMAFIFAFGKCPALWVQPLHFMVHFIACEAPSLGGALHKVNHFMVARPQYPI